MNLLSSLRRRSFVAACTVEIERSAESLHAHVVIDGDCEFRPGDEVLVHNPPTAAQFGERIFDPRPDPRTALRFFRRNCRFPQGACDRSVVPAAGGGFAAAPVRHLTHPPVVRF